MELKQDAFEAGWKKILSPGHVWVARLNSRELTRKTMVQGRLAAITAATLAVIVLILLSRGWFERHYETLLQPSVAGMAPDAAAPANSVDFQTMLVGATKDDKAPLADARSFATDLVKSVIVPLADGRLNEVSAQSWPAAGHPWPVDAVVYRKAGDDVLFVGARLKPLPYTMSTPGGAVWIGVAHREDGKWVVYNFVPDRYYGPALLALPQLKPIQASMIPRAVAALAK